MIVGARCRFHMLTAVGNYLISTVGDYHQRDDDIEPTPIGAGKDALYETFVFNFRRGTICALPDCDCGHPEPDEWGEIDGERAATGKAAREAHMRYCEKYAAAAIGGEGEGK